MQKDYNNIPRALVVKARKTVKVAYSFEIEHLYSYSLI